MNQILSNILTPINKLMNAIFIWLFAFIAHVPGWVSITVISAVTGVILIIIFKYTSNQKAIAKVRDSIKANILALKFYKDSFVVTMRCQGRILSGALLLLFHSLRPMAVMMVPVMLLLSQMSLWYQNRPLEPGEEAIIFIELDDTLELASLEPKIKSIIGAELIIDAVKVIDRNEIYWKIKAEQEGHHKIVFQIADEEIEKDLTIGQGFMRLSSKRPGDSWLDILNYPAEAPFEKASSVKSITLQYPERISKIYGTGWWVIYFFIASMIFALIAKPVLKVRI